MQWLQLFIAGFCVVLSFFVLDLFSYLSKKIVAQDDDQMKYLNRACFLLLPIVMITLYICAGLLFIGAVNLMAKQRATKSTLAPTHTR